MDILLQQIAESYLLAHASLSKIDTQQEGTIQLFAAAKCDVNEALYEADKALE